MKTSEPKKIHFNPVQLAFFSLLAQLSVVIAGRATGKTEGITATWLYYNIIAMPRSCGGLIVPKYEGAEKILAGIYKGWEKLGWIEGIHYVIGKRPPAHWKQRAFNAPRADFKNYISFYNGSGLYILSAKSQHNGANLDYLCCEEARLVPEAFYREIDLTVRGNEDVFGNLSCHGSRLWVTDQPRRPSERWVFNMQSKVSDPELIKGIRMANACLQQLMLEHRKEGISKTKLLEIERYIAKFKTQLNQLRMGTVYYHFASTLDNIGALGIRTIMNFTRTIKPRDFKISVLNKEVNQIEGGFYPALNPQVHGYYFDNDADTNRAIDIACDYNHSISCLVAGQSFGDEYRVINALNTKPPQSLRGVVKAFCQFYKGHKKKVVNYYYDHTALQGKNAVSDIAFFEQVITAFQQEGWIIVPHYIGAATTYDTRYYLFLDLLTEQNPLLPKFRYNLRNCEDLQISMQRAEASTSNNKTIKVKKDEKDKSLDQAHTTHNSEALDTLITGIFAERVGATKAEYVPM